MEAKAAALHQLHWWWWWWQEWDFSIPGRSLPLRIAGCLLLTSKEVTGVWWALSVWRGPDAGIIAVVSRCPSWHWQLICAMPCGVWSLVVSEMPLQPGGCHTQLFWAGAEATALAEAEEWVTHCSLLLLCFWLSSATACGKVKGEIFILIFRCSHSHLRMRVCVDATHM